MTDSKMPLHINTSTNTEVLGKVPPSNVEMEEAVLGALMLERNKIDEIASILTTPSFYRQANQLIYSTIIGLHNDNKPVDMLTIIERLNSEKKLSKVGGPAYISKLTNNIASGAHAEFHARIINESYLRRELIRISSDIQAKSYDGDNDINDLIDNAQDLINKLTANNILKNGEFIGEVGKRRLLELEEISKLEVSTTGVHAGKKINSITSGWQGGNFIILAARPSQGKTRIAQELAERGTESGKPIAFFSLEMMAKELYDRALSSKTGLENMAIRCANFDDSDWVLIDNAQRRIEDQKIIIDDTPALKISEFKTKARMLKKKHGIGMIVIDYIQLMKSPEHSSYREREVSDISAQIKALAKELDIPIIGLSQLSRKVDERPDKRPILSDLRDSGSLEQDADIVIFIYRPEFYGINEDFAGNSTKNVIKLIFAKNRAGAVGEIDLYKTTRWTSISDYRSDENEEVF